jgi:NADH-quinone oxidoreductase subunit M
MLRLVQGVIWGPAKAERTLPDLTLREWLMLLPMAILVVWLGLYPAPFLAPLHGAVAALLAGGLP